MKLWDKLWEDMDFIRVFLEQDILLFVTALGGIYTALL
jgi:hypothetical protein